MNSKHAKSYLIPGLVLAAAIALADQISKWWLIEYVLRDQPLHPNFLQWFFQWGPLERLGSYTSLSLAPFANLVMVWNEGISFGLFSGAENKSLAIVMLVALALAVCACVLFVLYRCKRGFQAVGLAMILGGALGNIYDRLRFGAVADFVDLFVGRWHWPAFNLADSAIVVGAVILVIDSFLTEEKET